MAAVASGPDSVAVALPRTGVVRSGLAAMLADSATAGAAPAAAAACRSGDWGGDAMAPLLLPAVAWEPPYGSMLPPPATSADGATYRFIGVRGGA